MGVDVGAWLSGLGLGQYEQAFRDNDIDPGLLPTLTADDLRELGVASLGHRKRLLAAIAALAEPTDPRPLVPPTPRAERRQLTVMFVDLVGSTTLAMRLDPEEMQVLLRAYQDAVAGGITRFGGEVAKYMGDGVLAYFGWPMAHEDAAERAVRAALAVREAVGRISNGDAGPLALRVGIATGLVLVGDLIGEGAAREEVVVGETPNLAARLQGLAEPGTIVVAERTKRLLGGLFEVRDLGGRQLRGFGEPVHAWLVLGPAAAESRFEALHADGLAPLVGRDQELALLLDRWTRAKLGEGQVVLLAGEPGIGKSRIVRALRERLRDEPRTSLRYHCSPYHSQSALWPVISRLERAAGFVRDDDDEVKAGKIETLFRQVSARVPDALPLVADLLSVQLGGNAARDEMSPRQRKARTFAALLAQLEALAAERPVLMVLEDAHWSDPTTLELFDRTVERIRRLPVLLIVTFRPELAPPWAGHAHATLLGLNRLGAPQVEAMVERVTDGKALPAEVLGQIVAKTDGVPLFVEELTKAVLELGLMREEGEQYVLDGPLPPLAIPDTLQGSLLARLDRLAPVKEVAQVGAVIGREFGHELLAAVAPLEGAALEDALRQLVAAELVFRRGEPPEATYVFKHALVQDAAYASLLKSRRRQLHARVVRALEEKFPEVLATKPEMMAQHYTAAGLAADAISYWLRAGQLALQRSAMKEAIAQLTQGLNLLPDLPIGLDRDCKEVDLQLALGNALIAAGAGAPGIAQTCSRAAELCERTGDTSKLVAALYGLMTFHFSRAELTLAREVAERALAAADRGNDVYAQAAGYFAVGWVSTALGRLQEAQAHLERAIALLESTPRTPLLETYGVDLLVISLAYLSWTLFASGYPGRARDVSRQALAEAQKLSHALTLAVALDRTTTVAELCRDTCTVTANAKRMLALGEEQGFPYYVAKANFNRGWVMVEEGRITDGIAAMRAALSVLQANRDEEFMPHSLALLAKALAKVQEYREALNLVSDALDRVKTTGERLFEAELHCLRGDFLLALLAPGEAEKCFHRAITVAREQDARWWGLHAATALAGIWAERGERRQAYDLLAPIYGWFRQGFDTSDLVEAKVLLDRLR
jgi:class 3 adenylate cyclase/predicted ATPase